jgi:hypothetical protein
MKKNNIDITQKEYLKLKLKRTPENIEKKLGFAYVKIIYIDNSERYFGLFEWFVNREKIIENLLKKKRCKIEFLTMNEIIDKTKLVPLYPEESASLFIYDYNKTNEYSHAIYSIIFNKLSISFKNAMILIQDVSKEKMLENIRVLLNCKVLKVETA